MGQQCLHIYGIQWVTFSHSYAHGHRRPESYSDANSYSSSEPNSDAYTNSNPDADGNSFAYADSNANRDTRFGSRGDQQSSARINSYFIDSYVHVERS